MKITNYQILEFDVRRIPKTFEDAKKLLKKKRKEAEKQYKDNLEMSSKWDGSGFLGGK